MENTESHNDFQQFERIEKFLLDELSAAEKQEFEKELKLNKSLEKSVEQHRAIIQALEREGMLEKINQFHKNTIEKNGDKNPVHDKPTFTIPRLSALLVAASILILVSIGLFRFISPSSNNQKIFSEFFEPDPGLITPMSAGADYLFFDGMIDYKRKDYKTAISKWEALEDTFAGTDTLNYFLGVAHLALKNDEQAIAYLQKALQIPDNVFIHETRHYLGLAYLKQGKTDEAIKLLKESEMAESKLVLDRLRD
ncbi:MAG: hypothetical protein EA361_09950 [Bacteroidetes bacterium]|nr:MAG: hypothetical protein EA361_09950 [Bacteroidota bacterium]